MLIYGKNRIGATGLYIEMSILYLSGGVVWLGSDVFGSALPVPTFSLILLVEICTFLFTGLVFIGDFCRLKIPPSPSSSCSDFGRSLKTGSSFISSSVMLSSEKKTGYGRKRGQKFQTFGGGINSGWIGLWLIIIFWCFDFGFRIWYVFTSRVWLSLRIFCLWEIGISLFPPT